MTKGKKTIVITVVAVVIVLMLYSGIKGSYNSFVTLDEQVNSAWAQVENQFQRRYDLIPNLVNTVKGYASHEKEVLTAVTDARSRVGSAQTIPDKIQADQQLTSALGRLMVVMENYPNLKADQSFLNLQSQLEGTENRISVERRRYSEVVQQYNVTIRRFPQSILAGMFGFQRKPFFEAVKDAQQAPKVKF
ncbi:MAG: LemA family protein [Chitinivibrionales bacterium]|nr:LemA family protein [Chitinivibrionales bacterium]